MASDQHRLGIMDTAAYRKITLRHAGAAVVGTANPIAGEEIRGLPEQENIRRAVFARYLNLTAGEFRNWNAESSSPRGQLPPCST